MSRGGEGPTDILCLLGTSGRGDCLLSRYGETLIVLFVSRGGDISVLMSICFVPFLTSRGGDGPTPISCLPCILSSWLLALDSLVGVTSRFICFFAVLPSRGGDGPQPVEVRSFFDFVLGFSTSENT